MLLRYTTVYCPRLSTSVLLPYSPTPLLPYSPTPLLPYYPPTLRLSTPNDTSTPTHC